MTSKGKISAGLYVAAIPLAFVRPCDFRLPLRSRRVDLAGAGSTDRARRDSRGRRNSAPLNRNGFHPIRRIASTSAPRRSSASCRTSASPRGRSAPTATSRPTDPSDRHDDRAGDRDRRDARQPHAHRHDDRRRPRQPRQHHRRACRSGSSITGFTISQVLIISSITGTAACCASCSLFTIDPAAA